MTMNLYRKILPIVGLVVICAGCIKNYTIPEEATIDSIFVGKWERQYFDEDRGYFMELEKTRMVDGTYKLVIIYYGKNKRYIGSTFELGEWWLYDGIYYEILPDLMDNPRIIQIRNIVGR